MGQCRWKWRQQRPVGIRGIRSAHDAGRRFVPHTLMPTPSPEAPGLAARRVAAELLEGVLRRHRPLDEQIEDAQPSLAALPERDRALTRALAATVLRRLGTLRHLLGLFLERGAPADAPRVETALLLGAAQILLLDVPDHAAVDLSVRLARSDRRAARYAGLVNAVLRRIAQQGAERLRDVDTIALDTPPWLLARWRQAFGAEMARAIAQANGREAALDLTVKQDSEHWAGALGGRVLPTGTVRTIAHGPVAQLSGFAEGAWWVQDAAAALPARLLGDVRGKTVADLCAAPGGKTAQLAQAGARVMAVATQWQAGPFDAVLLDAPCSSTGTIRRHPDIPWLKREGDLAELTTLQRSLLAHAVELVKPGGLLVYCTCSLEPEECEVIVTDLLARDSRLRRRPVTAAEVSGCSELLTAAGDLRTLPCHLPDATPQLGGMDGFYAARLERL